MIFLGFFGAVILILFSIRLAVQNWTKLFSGLEAWLLARKEEKILPLFGRLAFVSAIQANPESVRFSGIALWNLQIFAKRSGLLISCLFWISLWPILFFSEGFGRLNGLFVLGISGVLFLREIWTREESSFARFVFSIGLFLVAGEVAIRSGSALLNLAPDYPILFSLMDTSVLTLLSYFGLAVIISLLFRLEYWTLAIVLPLLYVNFISMLVAVAIFAGERLGSAIHLYFRTRPLSFDVRKSGRQMSIVASVGVVIGFVASVALRPVLQNQFGEGFEAFQSKQEVLVVLLSVLYACETAMVMLWGHFTYSRGEDSSDAPKFISPEWITSGLIRGQIRDLIMVELGRKKAALVQKHNEFGDDWSKVPATLQARLKYELSSITTLIDRLSR